MTLKAPSKSIWVILESESSNGPHQKSCFSTILERVAKKSYPLPCRYPDQKLSAFRVPKTLETRSFTLSWQGNWDWQPSSAWGFIPVFWFGFCAVYLHVIEIDPTMETRGNHRVASIVLNPRKQCSEKERLSFPKRSFVLFLKSK